MNFGELIAKGGALFARKGADALADTLEAAPPADLARIQAAVSGYLPLLAPVYVAQIFGDSLSTGDGSGGAGWSDVSYTSASNTLFAHMCRQSSGRIIGIRESGYPSQNSAYILGQVDSQIHPKINLGFVLVGTNDAVNSPSPLTVAQNVANAESIGLKIQAVGANVVIIALPPKNASRTDIMVRNRALRKMAAARKWRFVNPWSKWCAGDGSWVSGASDGTHPVSTVAQVAAQISIAQLFGAYPAPEIPFILPQENADPADRLYYLSSGPNCCLMTDSDANGIVDYWGNSTATGLTYSLVPAAYPSVGKMQVMTHVNVAGNQNCQRSMANGTVKANTWHVAVIRVKAADCVAGGLKWKLYVGGAGWKAETNFIGGDGDFVVMLPFYGPPADSNGYFGFYTSPVAATGSGVVSFAQAALYVAADIGLDLSR